MGIDIGFRHGQAKHLVSDFTGTLSMDSVLFAVL
jgi:hypothetical protein